jgi:acetyl-CoA C-acetyltransferase
MPEDAKEAMGHCVRTKRSKSGAASFDLVEMEVSHASILTGRILSSGRTGSRSRRVARGANGLAGDVSSLRLPASVQKLAITMTRHQTDRWRRLGYAARVDFETLPDANAGYDLREGSIMADAWIIDACRTPRGIGKAGKGALAGIHPQQLGAAVLRALADRTGIDTADVEDIVWGTSSQRGAQSGDLGRMSALDAGYDVRTSGVTLDRFCGSGITSVNMAAASIMARSEDLVIAGGTEMMSMEGRRGEGPLMMDAGNLRLRARHPQSHQGVCADAVATLEGITRQDVDRLGLESQQKAAAAIKAGYFAKSLVPVYREDGGLALDREEYPRPQTTLEGLAALKPAFTAVADYPLDDKGTTYRGLILQKYPDLKIDFVHHAGNSSGVVDGSAAILLASPDYAKAHGLKPRARVVAMANMGDSPTLMLNAPVPAARKVLAKAGLALDDIDLFEINEAFAVVTEKFIRDLELDRDKVNVNGGSIALGHPIGATGSILIGTILDELERRDLRRGLVTMCAAGGMAPAIIIERV